MPIFSTGPAIHLFHTQKAGICSQSGKQTPILWSLLSTGISKAASVLSLTALLSWSYRPPDKEEEEERLLTVIQLMTEEVSKGTAYQAAYFREGFFFFFYLNPPWDSFFFFFFFGEWKAFWRSCTSSKPQRQRPESFLLNERWQNYRTQPEFVEGDLWSGIFPNHLVEDRPHRLPSSENY